MAKKVLIIDDDPEFTTSTSDILENLDFDVITASEGAQGVEKARHEKPDLILLDVMMEDGSAGLESARILRDEQETSSIPIIILTGIRRADQLLESYAPGETWPNVKAALEKPVAPDFFVKTIQKVTGTI